MTTLVSKPFYSEFVKLVERSSKSIYICSPYIKYDIVREIYNHKAGMVDLKVLTNINLASFYKGASDVNAIELFLSNGHKANNFPHLHAKFYIFDEQQMIITSANLTSSGLKRNLEYGVYTDELSLVDQAVKDFNRFSKNTIAGKITVAHLETISSIIDGMGVYDNNPFPQTKLEFLPDDDFIPAQSLQEISLLLGGWTRVLFEELITLPNVVFTTSDFQYILPRLKQKYPDNNTIEAKIRQQLQELRDLGLIKFVKRGTYQKLWK